MKNKKITHYQIFYLHSAILLILANLVIFSGCNTLGSFKGESGFVPIFNGIDLDDWTYDSTYWRVQDGVLVGEITSETLLERNSFIIWEGGEVQNFELKVEYRISMEGNSGINYRSERVEGDPDLFIGGIPFALKGYQGDIDGHNRYTGMNYEERKRTTIARRGESVTLPHLKNKENLLGNNIVRNQWSPRKVNKSLGEPDSLLAHINEGWNEYHIVAKGNHLQHYVNGILMSEVTDNDEKHRKNKGLLGFQVHVGPPMIVQFRSILLKQLN